MNGVVFFSLLTIVAAILGCWCVKIGGDSSIISPIASYIAAAFSFGIAGLSAFVAYLLYALSRME